MGMRVQELHPSVIHVPLALLPTAAVVDLWAAVKGDRRLARFGRGLWVAGAASGLFAGLAGLAASQEVNLDEKEAHDTVLLHGLVNVGIVGTALGVTAWRASHRPNVALALAGLGACGVAFYSAYLGGEAVYGQGVGVRPLSTQPRSRDVPRLLSWEAPRTLASDAVRGLFWLGRHAWRLLRGEEQLERAAEDPPPARPARLAEARASAPLSRDQLSRDEFHP